jgi:predicted transcriptional regulator of viral defense system
MFHGKFVIVTEVQPIVKTQTVTTNVNVVNVNVTTRNKAIEECVQG